MRAFRFSALLALVSACAAAIFVAPAGASVSVVHLSDTTTTCGGLANGALHITLQNPPPTQQAADIVLLVDRSGSINSTDFATVRSSLNTFITNAAPSATGNHIGVVGFSTGAQNLTSGLLSDPATLHSVVTSMADIGGFTYTKDGLTAANAMLTGPSSRPGAPKVIVIETDGVWTTGLTPSQDPTAYAAGLVAGGTSIYVVGVGGVNVSDLTAIAGGNASHVFSVSNYSALESALNSALAVVTPAATNLHFSFTAAPGWIMWDANASDGVITSPTATGFQWSLASYNSATARTLNVFYSLRHVGLTGGPAVPVSTTALLTYTDDHGVAQSFDYSSQTVAVTGCNRPPTANAGPDQTVVLSGSPTANVSMDGSASSDPDADSLTYSWAEGSTTLGTGVAPTMPLGIGSHTITLTVSDGQYSSSDDVVVNVVDNSPPTVTPHVGGTQHNGWFTSDAVVSFTVTDDESAITSESADCAGTTVNADTAGQTFTCTATSAGGTGSGTATVKRDTAGPSIAFGGNAGTYQLGDTVAITCTASDALSGLAGPANCGGVSGAAWTFGAGSHTITRTSSDVAGNSTTRTTSFTVDVTAAGLCQLVRLWSDNAGVANSLCVKIAHDTMAAFRNELAAQRGKHIPADKADIIRALSLGL